MTDPGNGGRHSAGGVGAAGGGSGDPSGGHATSTGDNLPERAPSRLPGVPRASTPVLRKDEPAAIVERPRGLIRRDSRVGKVPRSPDWMLNNLPVGMLQSSFFVRFVSIFQELGSGLLEDADLIDNLVDGTVTPVPMLSHLASWIGIDTLDASIPEELQRVILASSAKALAWRGTRSGLIEYLKMLSGGEATVEDGGGVWAEGESPDDVAWVRMSVLGTGHLSEDELVALVKDEIPAHVRAELWVAGRRVLSTADDPGERGRR